MNENIPQAPSYVAGVKRLKSSTSTFSFLRALADVVGFNLGRQIGEAFRKPTGVQIRDYCANTTAIVQVVENPPIDGQPQTFKVQAVELVPVPVKGTIKFRQSDKEPGTPVRELFVIDPEVTTANVEQARQAAELFVVGWNQCREEVVGLSRASCRQANQIIAVALAEYRSELKAAQKAEAPVGDLTPAIA